MVNKQEKMLLEVARGDGLCTAMCINAKNANMHLLHIHIYSSLNALYLLNALWDEKCTG